MVGQILEEFETDDGVPYWFDRRTGETFWERPLCEEEKVKRRLFLLTEAQQAADIKRTICCNLMHDVLMSSLQITSHQTRPDD